ncbi:hypothetical protein C8R46DRAFT_1125105 [Mycena filopes]|nr:hypothetical protein C8R46DRAFT_1125105 [Mycena filopes]
MARKRSASEVEEREGQGRSTRPKLKSSQRIWSSPTRLKRVQNRKRLLFKLSMEMRTRTSQTRKKGNLIVKTNLRTEWTMILTKTIQRLHYGEDYDDGIGDFGDPNPTDEEVDESIREEAYFRLRKKHEEDPDRDSDDDEYSPTESEVAGEIQEMVDEGEDY